MDNDSQAIFAQNDSRWGRERIGTSVLTLAGWGCTITATCRSLFLLRNMVLNPSEMEDTLEFTTQSHPQGAGLLLWGSYANIGMKATRGWGKPPEFKKGMLLELNYNPRHWVAFESADDVRGDYVMVMDPLKAEIVRKRVSEISGYTYIEATEDPIQPPSEVSNWAKGDWNEWMARGVLTENSKPKSLMTKEEYAVFATRLEEYFDKKY